MADGPFQPFTANPSSDGTKSTVGKMGGKRPFAAVAVRASSNDGSWHSERMRNEVFSASPRALGQSSPETEVLIW